jgi:hypothetical protein
MSFHLFQLQQTNNIKRAFISEAAVNIRLMLRVTCHCLPACLPACLVFKIRRTNWAHGAWETD